jgi:two-component system sensor histidine kinase/response regulator
MSLSFRKAMLLYLLAPIILIFLFFAVENLISIKNDNQLRIENHSIDLAISYANIYDGFLKPIAGAAQTNAELMEINPEITEDKIFKLLEMQLNQNPLIYGAAIAFMPRQFNENRRLFAPYIYRKEGKLIRMDIGKSAYDYTDSDWEWWNDPTTTGQPGWTEPYFDEAAGNILMSTYAVPFYKDNNLWGVATMDIPLHKISNAIHIPGVKSQEISVITSKGKIILHPYSHEIGRSIYDVLEQNAERLLTAMGSDYTEEINALKEEVLAMIKNMLAGEAGKQHLTSLSNNEVYWYFYAPIASAQWNFSIRIKEADAFKSVNERFWYSLLFFGIFLALIIFSVILVSGKLSKALAWLIGRCQRIERLNFQTADNTQFEIDEIYELSNTLNKMAQALDSHLSIKADVSIAKAIRQQALPQNIPDVPGFQIAICSLAIDEGCREVYDVIEWPATVSPLQETNDQQPKGAGFMLLDDSDNGINATVKNIQLRSIFRTLFKKQLALEEIAQRMNDYLFTDSVLNGSVQAWFGSLDAHKAGLLSLNMGQNVVLHFSAKQNRLQKQPGNAYPLSARHHLTDLFVQDIKLEQQDIIVIVSDGVVGALNKQREQFGIAPIEKVVRENRLEHAEAIVDEIKHGLSAFVKDAYIQTDYTVIVIKRCVEQSVNLIPIGQL